MPEVLASLIDIVEKHDNDLYHGDLRKPGITTRIQQLEDFKEDMLKYKEDLQSYYRNVMIAVIGSILVTVGSVVIALFKH